MTDPIARLNAALEDRYAIERELGEGGMATVYLAKDLKHNRNVALKVLKPELAAVVGAERFLAEIETTANLTHPHILPLFDSGEADGFLFYVMPHIPGESLRERIDREKQLGVDDSVAITQKVADALDYAHENGVVHRDIKPANILLSERGEPLVADFGIALAVAQAGAGRITETGLSLGTPHYMSPEQATGDRDVDPRSDVYALGCVLYEMLAGQPPFSATTAQAVLVQILTVDAPSITVMRRTVSPNVGAALAKSLEKLPADRFTSAAEFAVALADPSFTYEARARTTVATPTPEPLAPVPQATGIDRRVFSAVILVAATMTALAAWGWLKPAPQLPVTLTSISLDNRSFRGPGEILVSPDGRRFALAGLAPPDPTIYWRNADEEEFRPIPGTENVIFAAFSPDGESLVFSALGGASVRRVALSGGAPQTLAELPVGLVGGLHWGDDGNIVFSHIGGLGLYRMPATGGDPEPLLDPTTPVRNPRLLPGGRAVIFTDPAALSTLILDLQTDSVRVLRAGAIDAVYVETGHLLYADVSGTLWAVAFDARRGEVVGEPVTLFDGVSRPSPFWARFAVSQSGTLVYSTGFAGAGGGLGAQRLVIVDLEGNEEILALGPRHFGDLKWSPDGRSVVYESIPEGESAAHIYTYDVEVEATPRQLTFEGDNRSPVYSPDGTRVVFSSLREGTDGRDLFVKRLDDDTPAELLITLPRDQLPHQWPSDTLIVFGVGPPPVDQWMLDLSDPDSPRAEVYLEQEADLREPVVSPDGTLAAYSSDETGTTEIYVRSFPDPGERTPVSEGGGDRPRWSPDGNTVYYWTTGGGGVTFVAARLRREPTPMVLSRDPLFTGVYFRSAADLHPAGNQIIVGRLNLATPQDDAASEPERFIVVTNWFEELRQRMGN